MLAIILLAATIGQQCAPDPKPLTHAKIGTLDPFTTVLGGFDTSLAMQGMAGGEIVKSTHTLLSNGGIFGSGALAVPNAASVGIYRADIQPGEGTVEMWVKVGAPTSALRYLFSARGARGLDLDGHSDLIVGETSLAVTPFFSKIYFNDGAGLDLGKPTLVLTVAPRGIAVGDVNGDDVLDLVVAQNFANTLPNPVTGDPGEVHVFLGPIVKGAVYSTPDIVIEVDKPQGLILAQFDQHPGLDLVVGSFSTSSQPIYGFSNNGSGSFTPMNFQFGSFTSSAEGLAAADVNGDGVLDVLYGSFDQNPSTILLGQINGGDYELIPAPGMGSIRSGQALGVSLADVDGDGDDDIVLAQTLTGQGQLAIHLNQGDGTFNFVPDCLVPTKRPFTVSAYRDLNNDGYLDIVVANWRDGPNTTPTSTVYFGPIEPPAGSPPTTCIPPHREFLVEDAVSMAVGDLDSDGLDDLFFHSGTAAKSPVFLLDVDGEGKSGFVADGKYVADLLIPTTPTKANPAGEGSGVHVATGGTTTYGTIHVDGNCIELYLLGNDVHFRVTDRRGAVHEVSAPFPFSGSAEAVDGFHHLQAEWSATQGIVELRVGHPGKPANVHVSAGVPYPMGSLAPVFRVGSDPNNQRRAAGILFDDLRISSVRRSSQDADLDGVLDEWDNCRFLPNTAQADINGDGVGDDCSVCQVDLGYRGPGTLELSACGQLLKPGNLTSIGLRCGPAGTVFGLFVALASNPTPAFGGVFVPLPIVAVGFGQLNSAGQYHQLLPAIVGVTSIYAQAVAVDPAASHGAQLSNAVRIDFLP